MNYNNLPNLDESVLAALDFFSQKRPVPFKPAAFDFPIVVGSGNAYNTGVAIFSGQAAIIADESNLTEVLSRYKKLIKNKTIRQAVIISASGEKDSVWEIAAAKRAGLKTYLMTCNEWSAGAKLADKVIPYRKLPEPYTYNVSTYLGMILSATNEDPRAIRAFLKRIKVPKNFFRYQAYAFLLPDDQASIAPMLEKKRNELFGSWLSIRTFSYGEARHAEFVNEREKELVISLGSNRYFGCPSSRWEIKLPKKYGAALIMALGYYLIGRIQSAKPQYFKSNIRRYCLETGPKPYGQKKPFEIIVPGN